jgi:DUF971 family protein
MTTLERDFEKPLALRVMGSSGRLEMDWAGGRTTAVTHAKLREQCRCAVCVARRQCAGSINVPPDVRLTDVTPFGPNAVRLTFSDGHGRGIYPFEWLQTLATAG